MKEYKLPIAKIGSAWYNADLSFIFSLAARSLDSYQLSDFQIFSDFLQIFYAFQAKHNMHFQ